MKSQRCFRLILALVLVAPFALAQQPVATSAPAPATPPAASPDKRPPVVIPDTKLTVSDRTELIRGLAAEMAYVRKPFPMGKLGLKLEAKTGVVTPDDQTLASIMAGYGPALKAGDRARITDIRFKDKSIIFEINGGPQKKKKWFEHIEISGMGGAVQPGQPTDQTNVRGSSLELTFDKFVPDLKSGEVKQLLDPVFNFSAKSATEAYEDTIPPKAKEAIKDHRVLVGMNRDMVVIAKGRPPQKTREKEGDNDYEEWIYGVPPQDVEFIRFMGDEVVRVETMKVDGTKQVRTERELVIQKEEPQVAQQGQPPVPDQSGQPSPTQTTATSDDGPKGRPSLRRPGEDTIDAPPPPKPRKLPADRPDPTGPDPTVQQPGGPPG